MSTTVVTLAHGRHDHLRRQQRSLSRGSHVPDDVVVVAMGDPELDAVADGHVVHLDVGPAGLPLAAARNAGARAAIDRGADVLVFLDVDCLAGPDLVAAYGATVTAHRGTVWSGPVTYLPEGTGEAALDRPWLLDAPHAARPAPAPGELIHDADPDLFWSLSFALHREAWEQTGGFCEEYAGYGGEDTDFAQQATARGLDLGWVGGARAYHQWHPTESPPVRHLDDILRNGALFHRRWGRWPMLGWLEVFEQRGLVRRDAHGGWSPTDRPSDHQPPDHQPPDHQPPDHQPLVTMEA